MTTNNAVNTTLAGQTGTGNFVGATSPALVTPALGTPASGNLLNCTGFPVVSTLISTATASNSASISLTGMTGYTTYLIYFDNLLPATNGTNLLMRVSTNGGSTYISAAGSYAWALTNSFSTSVVAAATQSDTSITLAVGIINSGTVTGGGRIDIINPASTNDTVFLSHTSTQDSGSNILRNATTCSQFLSTTTVNAIQLLMSSGNMTTGNFYLYGIK